MEGSYTRKGKGEGEDEEIVVERFSVKSLDNYMIQTQSLDFG